MSRGLSSHFLPPLRAAAATLVGLAASAAWGQSDPVPGPPPAANPPMLPSRPSEDFDSHAPGAAATPSRASERVLADISMLSGEAVRLAQVASQRAANSQVRSFADQVASSCGELERDADQIATNKNVTVPTGKKANAMAEEDDRWQRKNARDFDEDYVKRTVKIHEDTIDELEDYVGDQDADPEIAAFAKKYLPSLRENLRQAEGLRRQMD